MKTKITKGQSFINIENNEIELNILNVDTIGYALVERTFWVYGEKGILTHLLNVKEIETDYKLNTLK